MLVYRLRQLKEEPYSQKEAEAAAGLFTDNGRRQTEQMVVDEDVQDPAAAFVDLATAGVEPGVEQDGVEAIQ